MTRLALALARLQGSCPVCGDDVPRTKMASSDGLRETYSCPRHGAIEYGPRTISLLTASMEPDGPVTGLPGVAVWEV